MTKIRILKILHLIVKEIEMKKIIRNYYGIGHLKQEYYENRNHLLVQ